MEPGPLLPNGQGPVDPGYFGHPQYFAVLGVLLWIFLFLVYAKFFAADYFPKRYNPKEDYGNE